MLRVSSTVEHSTVNRQVAGSNPARGAYSSMVRPPASLREALRAGIQHAEHILLWFARLHRCAKRCGQESSTRSI